ncbi:MAG: hypothetical protein HY332_15840 [Chloroflexi bacterium]|nr:hypothetical protein [Chloroflexota bacterium]
MRQAAMAMVRDRGGGRILVVVRHVPHVPDGLLTLPSAERWAAKVELTRKPDGRARAGRSPLAHAELPE